MINLAIADTILMHHLLLTHCNSISISSTAVSGYSNIKLLNRNQVIFQQLTYVKFGQGLTKTQRRQWAGSHMPHMSVPKGQPPVWECVWASPNHIHTKPWFHIYFSHSRIPQPASINNSSRYSCVFCGLLPGTRNNV